MRKNNRMSVLLSLALSFVLLCGLFTLAAGAVGGVLAGDGPAEFEWVDAAGLENHAVPSAFARYYAEAGEALMTE